MHRVIDDRDIALAKLLVRYSTKVRRGEAAMVSAVGGDCIGLAQACLEEILAAGGVPYFHFIDPVVQRSFIAHGTEDVFRAFGAIELSLMKKMKVFIGIRAADNAFELNGLPNEQLDAYTKHVSVPVHLKQRVKHTRWVVLRYPNSAMAQLAQMSSDEFADFYYEACLVNYEQMRRGALALKRFMEQTSEVRITGPGTDLRLSIEKMPVIACCGEMNIPDGECFTAPRKFSIEGQVTFNAPTIWEGQAFDDISLTFRRGQVVVAKAATVEQTRRLEKILERDAGARYVGEFALGFHPTIQRPMRDILFDEKIGGSFHMALGQCYDEAPNGNKSQIHWDLVCIQLPEYGGGEIYFDDQLVRKDGLFIPRELAILNPDKSLSKSKRKK